MSGEAAAAAPEAPAAAYDAAGWRPSAARATVRPAPSVCRGRLGVVAIVFALAFAVIAVRLVTVSLDGWTAAAARLPAPAPAAPESGSRGDITDRDGTLLAASLPTASLYGDGQLIDDPADAAARLAGVLDDLDVAATAQSLDSDRRFIWLRRGLTPAQHYAINALGVPGFGFRMENRRFYPTGRLTAPLVGFTDTDEVGLAGIERAFHQTLDGGETLALSIDLAVQAMLRQELVTAVGEFNAAGAIGLVLHIASGEVLAMVTLPDFDPADRGPDDTEAPFNPAVQGVYEMGSTFKIFNTALVLETGIADLDDQFDATHPIRVDGHTISDYHGEYRWLTVAEIFRHSSNIGSARMAIAAGRERQRALLDALGLTRPAPIPLTETAAPLVPDPWRDINVMTIAFGHGIAVSPMQLAAATAAVVGDGLYRPPTLLRRDPAEPIATERVVSSETSRQMRWLMRQVVMDGTGRNADAEGYLVGGKTGTAEKTAGRGYDGNALLSSFVAAFPMDDPEFVVLVMLDEPNLPRSQGRPTGGRVAAPVVRRVIERLGPMTGLAPVPPAMPEIRDASLEASDPSAWPNREDPR